MRKAGARFAGILLMLGAAVPGALAGDAPGPDEAAGAERQGPMTPTDKVVARFMALDTDESSGVSLDEYLEMVRARAEERFQAMDTDGDGEVTDEEFRAFWQSRKARWYRFRR
ncbi:MAG: EF-hand domain-containing protein [Mariprofundaceae bacterium]